VWDWAERMRTEADALDAVIDAREARAAGTSR
jgi:hypothetical protein